MLWAILLIFSYSRQAIVSLLATYMMYLYFRKSAKATWKYLLWGTVPLLVLIIAGQRFVLPRNYLTTGIGNVQGSIWERYVSMFSFDFLREDYKGHGRTWFLTEGLKRILEVHPFLGFGIGMYGCPDTTFIDDSTYMTLGISTQSYYMDVYIGCIIGQIGIIGFVCYMCSFIVVFRKCFHIMACSQKVRNERIVNFANLSEKQAEICRKLSFQNLLVADFEFFAFEKFAGLGTRPYYQLPQDI